MQKTEPKRKLKFTQHRAEKILSFTEIETSFRFFTDVDQDTGITAASLTEFIEQLKTIHPKAIEFHFQRGDFEKWIATIIQDEETAHKIANIKPNQNTEHLRQNILSILHKRCKQLLNAL